MRDQQRETQLWLNCSSPKSEIIHMIFCRCCRLQLSGKFSSLRLMTLTTGGYFRRLPQFWHRYTQYLFGKGKEKCCMLQFQTIMRWWEGTGKQKHPLYTLSLLSMSKLKNPRYILQLQPHQLGQLPIFGREGIWWVCKFLTERSSRTVCVVCKVSGIQKNSGLETSS